ncbi:MAG TPA: hypothetical protein VGY97_07470 [Solirubrobacteraceae bacterium]|nr:hypothetical protein [Solirubrobacteraceae bacterium]
MRTTITRAACTALALQAVGAAAAQASTLTAKVTPPDPGSAQSPQPHTTTIGLDKMDPGPGGNANSAAVKLVESMPVDFAATLEHYATCPSSKVVHGDKKPSCPDSSVLGNVTATAYVPALVFSTTSDQGYIFKIGDNAVRAWVHVTSPQEAGVVVDGALGRGAAPYGPVITWDFSTLASGAQAGVEVRINSVAFIWNEQTGSAASTMPGSPTAGTHTVQSRSCQAKARRIKKSRKRRAALRRCAKSKPKKARKGSARVAQATSTYAPFVSTGCSGGVWPFHAEATYSDGTKETADAKVTCASTTGSPPSSPPPSSPPGPPASPLCPPACGLPGPVALGRAR